MVVVGGSKCCNGRTLVVKGSPYKGMEGKGGGKNASQKDKYGLLKIIGRPWDEVEDEDEEDEKQEDNENVNIREDGLAKLNEIQRELDIEIVKENEIEIEIEIEIENKGEEVKHFVETEHYSPIEKENKLEVKKEHNKNLDDGDYILQEKRQRKNKSEEINKDKLKEKYNDEKQRDEEYDEELLIVDTSLEQLDVDRPPSRCRFYELGLCRYGRKCRNRHKLRVKCRYFLKNNSCKYGSRCRYEHEGICGEDYDGSHESLYRSQYARSRSRGIFINAY